MSTRRSARLLAAATLAAVLSLTACGGAATSYSSLCSGGVCTVNLTGEQTFEVDGTDGVERNLGVGPIEADAVTLSVAGDRMRLAPGRSATIADVPVEVLSVAGRDVSLRIGGSEVESADSDTAHSSAGHRSTKSTSAKSTRSTSTKTRSTTSR